MARRTSPHAHRRTDHRRGGRQGPDRQQPWLSAAALPPHRRDSHARQGPNAYPWAVIGRALLLRPHLSAQGAAVVIARRTASALQPLAPWRIAFPHGADADGLGYAASSATSRLCIGLGDTIAVLDAESGRVLSRHHVDGSVDSLAVSLRGDEVYAATEAAKPTVDHLLAMDPRSGSLKWDRVQDGPIGVLGAR